MVLDEETVWASIGPQNNGTGDETHRFPVQDLVWYEQALASLDRNELGGLQGAIHPMKPF